MHRYRMTPSADHAKSSNSIAKESGAGMRGMAKKKPQPAIEPAHVFHAVQTVGLRGEPRYGAAKEYSLASGARVVRNRKSRQLGQSSQRSQRIHRLRA